MGEVYRARDTRLDRTVALKVLPEQFFENEERKSRFEREAKLLAAPTSAASFIPAPFRSSRCKASRCSLGRLHELERLYDALLILPNELRAHPSAAILVLRASPSSVMLAWGDELRWHGHPERSRVFVTRALGWLAARPEGDSRSAAHRNLLAQALLSAGRDTEAETVLSRLAAEHPDRVAYRGLLGVLAARRGDRKNATEISKRLREVNQPYLFGFQTRYAGAIAAWLGEKEQAVALLRENLGQGLTPLGLHADGLLYPIWNYPPFQELLNPKG